MYIVGFFDILQKSYTYFTASTYRWTVLQTNLGKRQPVVQCSDGMKWSAKDEAVKAIAVSYTEIYAALDEIADDNSYKPPDVRNEARGLVTAPRELDTGFMIVLWRRVPNRFVENSARLQSADQDISTVADIYASLIGFIETLRDDFDDMELGTHRHRQLYTPRKQNEYQNATDDTMKAAVQSLKKCDRHVTCFVKIRFLSSLTP